ncbi:imidazole glycerol phosphate synthase subunit HisF [Anaeroselena agilis]|uniref:Imidazole glycerol phosphate synthase subunit HisF n=1 Tax=Anaeroselena agilis TaxID=3063788 RepID=A0ABU3P5H5_9FIRM|nr:imidazole glycerol phosphate synthase cyclase subunit [Selenomonadales bacterium 4137-cl]
MLKTRIIPTLLWKDVGLVKGVAFDSWRRIGTVMPAVKVYNTRQVDELMLLDITATEQQREPDYDTINEIAAECFVPLTVGGGIRTIDHIKDLLRAGADKVCINSAAFDTPELIAEAAGKFGTQCVVVSLDVAKNPAGEYECVSLSGKRFTGRPPEEWARRMEELGAGEILLTSVERDGTMQGYDIPLIKQVAGLVSIPVIASGGAGNYHHMYEAIAHGNASAVAAASIFHFTEQTPLEAKQYLGSKGVPVRNINLRQPA